jgi:hypothetical protein
MKIYLGVDNGVTGPIAVLDQEGTVLHFGAKPVKNWLNYTKEKRHLQRVIVPQMVEILRQFPVEDMRAFLERPLVNPQRWNASVSAIRADEAVLNVVEILGVPYQYLDSKEWQRELLPTNPIPRLKRGASAQEKKAHKAALARIKGETKKLSLEVGKRLFPGVNWSGQKDADALLIAEWARRNQR